MPPDVSEREDAWDAVHEALPARWHVGFPSYDPGALRADGYRGAWSVTARGPHPGRGKVPQTVRGLGDNEIAALRNLDDRLHGVAKPDGTQIQDLRRRMRLAYVDGAEAWTRQRTGRGLTDLELAAVLKRFPVRSVKS